MSKIPVVIDTREQLPWNLNLDVFEVERGTLVTGDYTIKGMEDRFVIERKNLGDLVETVIHDWIRFRKELWRMAAFDFACIVVEAEVGDVMAHQYESAANPDSVMGRIHSIWLDHGIPTFFWGARTKAGCVGQVEQLLKLAWGRYG